MKSKSMTKRMGGSFFCLLALIASMAVAQEQRCKDLGANCVCSEPLNTTVYTLNGDAYFHNPGDSKVKECTSENGLPIGTAIQRGSIDYSGSNDPAILSKLPSGRTLSYFLHGREGHQGMFFIGHAFGSQYTKRVAVRWYIYHSDNYEFAQDGACSNSKFAQIGPSPVDKSFGYVHWYGWQGYTPYPGDCCMSGPGPQNVQKADWRGKWWRVEVVMTNRAGPGLDSKIYLKNITDNVPEITVVDLQYTGYSYWKPSPDLTPPSRIDGIVSNNHRYSPNGACNGWNGFIHFMYAGWDTDAGQRIGPAQEVEGVPSSLKGNVGAAKAETGLYAGAQGANQGIRFRMTLPRSGDFDLRVFDLRGAKEWARSGKSTNSETEVRMPAGLKQGTYVAVLDANGARYSCRFAVLNP